MVGGDLTNPLLMLAPLGMVLVGLLSIYLWKKKSRVGLKYFFFGGLVWFAAITPKIILDYLVTPNLSRWTIETYGFPATYLVLGSYVGLRTGLLECGFTYLALSRSRLREASLDEATAFGVGFGAFESILLGLPALMQIAFFIANPSILNLLPQAQRQAVESQLNLPTWVVPAPIIERTFTLFVHVFTILLVFASTTRRSPLYFLAALLYKSLLDGAIPYLQATLKPGLHPSNVYLTEVWVIVLGAISLAGALRIRRTLSERIEKG